MPVKTFIERKKQAVEPATNKTPIPSSVARDENSLLIAIKNGLKGRERQVEM